eukprot:COSAG01_NODE_39302_length_478_cov_1.044855_1_plen_41_part_00
MTYKLANRRSEVEETVQMFSFDQLRAVIGERAFPHFVRPF